jgi:hypothetical protein
MPNRNSLVQGMLALMLLSGLRLPAAARTDWPPITEEEKSMKDCAQQPGAAAIYLYREEIMDAESYVFSVFRRLKILTPAGREYGNIEISYFKGWTKVQDFEARLIPPDGGPRPFTGQVFEKTALRAGGLRMTVKTAALPNVEPGCIIDYRYKIVADSGGGGSRDSEEIFDNLQLRRGKPQEGGEIFGREILSLPAETWEVQSKLFTRKAKFAFAPSPYAGYLFKGFWRLGWFSQRIAGVKPKMQGGRLELEAEDIPAFEKEEFMTPEEIERMSVEVFYCDRRLKNADEYWKRECKTWQEGVEDFLGSPRKLSTESSMLVDKTAAPIENLKKLYARAQRIRNLSYEKPMTRKQRKDQKIKDNHKVADVLERDYGLRSDITRAFVALARAAGFEAEVVRVVNRDDKIFQPNLPTFYDQFDGELALVKLDNREVVCDPATPFCPLGLVHWSRSNTTAVRRSDSPPAFIVTPALPPDMALTQREIALELDLQGNLKGTVKVTFQGQDGLIRRLKHLESDEAEKKKDLEAELTAILPVGATVTLKKLENMANDNPSVFATYEVAVPGIVTTAGKRMLLPVSPLLGDPEHPFSHAQRKYPVYFPYPHREFNDIIITLPQGVSVESSPASRRNQQEFADYSLVCVAEGTQRLHAQRDLIIKKSLFSLEQYRSLKGFFDDVRASDEQQVVLSTEKR